MFRRTIILSILVFFTPYFSHAFAENGGIGDDLGQDIYRRLDEGVYSVKKKLLENRLEQSTLLLNGLVGKVCRTKS
jgi:hypothetical protein